MASPTRFRRFLVTGTLMIVVHATFAVILTATIDFEIVPFAVLVTGFAAPSILLYAALIARATPRLRQSAAIFLASLLPFSLGLAHASIYAPEGKGIAAKMLALYVLPAVLALAVDVLFVARD